MYDFFDNHSNMFVPFQLDIKSCFAEGMFCKTSKNMIHLKKLIHMEIKNNFYKSAFVCLFVCLFVSLPLNFCKTCFSNINSFLCLD